MGLLYDREYGPNGRMMLLHLNCSILRDIIFYAILMELYTVYVLDFLTRAAQCAIQRFSKKMHGPRGAINKWRAIHKHPVKSLKKA